MKKLLSLEEVAQLAAVIYLLVNLPAHFSIGWCVVIFFLPDVYAMGYLVNNTLGTFMYNLAHHKLVAIGLIAIGYFKGNTAALQLGYLFYAHSCFDRAIGYGLKYLGNPNKTHLGFIGKEKSKNTPDTF